MNEPEYFQNNLYLISKMFGNCIKEINRISFSRSNDFKKSGRISVEPLLISMQNDLELYIDIDEGMANILVYEVTENQNLQSRIQKSLQKNKIYPSQEIENKNIIISQTLKDPIVGINLISRKKESFDFYKMCGFQMRFSNKNTISIGAYINPSKTSDICILTQDELDKNLDYKTFLE
jgi:hypothetical protein